MQTGAYYFGIIMGFIFILSWLHGFIIQLSNYLVTFFTYLNLKSIQKNNSPSFKFVIKLAFQLDKVIHPLFTHKRYAYQREIVGILAEKPHFVTAPRWISKAQCAPFPLG